MQIQGTANPCAFVLKMKLDLKASHNPLWLQQYDFGLHSLGVHRRALYYIIKKQ
jgi:hypothetical protein